jgi:hypothetical protein
VSATGVGSSSAAFFTTAGNEQPISVVLPATVLTTILTVPAADASGGNRKKVLWLRFSPSTGAGTPTLLIELVRTVGTAPSATGTFVIRGNSALTAGEVYRESDILLMPGDTLRATASTETHVTGQYIDQGRGPGIGA